MHVRYRRARWLEFALAAIGWAYTSGERLPADAASAAGAFSSGRSAGFGCRPLEIALSSFSVKTRDDGVPPKGLSGSRTVGSLTRC